MTCIWVDCQDVYREAMANIAPKENVARGLQAYPSWDRLDGIEKARIARMEARAKDDKATKAMAQRRQRVLEALPGTMDEVADSTGCKRSTLERDMRILRSVDLIEAQAARIEALEAENAQLRKRLALWEPQNTVESGRLQEDKTDD